MRTAAGSADVDGCVLGNPVTELCLSQISGGKGSKDLNLISLGWREPDSVQAAENGYRKERSTLVPVDKRMIASQAEAVCCCQHSDVRFGCVSMYVARPLKGAFE